MITRQRLSHIDRAVIKLFRLIISLLLHSKLDSAHKPAYTKSYAINPKLKHRIFLPATYDANSDVKYPLFIEIHGGGYIMGEAATDDEFCSYVSAEAKVIVISLEYRKSPEYQFPIPLLDCAGAIRQIMADSTLRIDHSRVAIGGMSAGGNLALSIAQREEFRGVFDGMVIWYPIVDWTVSLQTRLDFRPKNKDGSPDALLKYWRYIDGGYLPISIDRTDPSISPVYSANENFPSKAYLIDAQNDILSYDTFTMAKKLANARIEVDDLGSEGLLKGWRAGDVRWNLAIGQTHGFNDIRVKLKGQDEVDRLKVTKEIFTRISQWLSEEVFI